jgi:hypothetical protein
MNGQVRRTTSPLAQTGVVFSDAMFILHFIWRASPSADRFSVFVSRPFCDGACVTQENRNAGTIW